MISIQTVKVEKNTGKPIYKTYRHTGTNSIKVTMELINVDRENNDLAKYSSLEIIDIWDDIED